MTGSTYKADRWEDAQASGLAPFSQGISGTASANTTTNFDIVLADDVLFEAIEVLITGALFGDTVTMQVIDTNGVTGAPPGTVVLQPVLNWNVATDIQTTLSYDAKVPKKALATMTIRLIYTSTALLTPVKVAINYRLLKCLV